MTLPAEPMTKTASLTESAAEAVQEIMSQKNLQGYGLRLFISGGGCSGYQYGLALDNRFRAEDMVTETNGIRLIVDEVSIKYLQGATVDYIREGDASGFKIINPNPLSSCSCNQSSSSQDTSEGDCPGCS